MSEPIQQLEDSIAVLRSGTTRSQLGSRINRAAIDTFFGAGREWVLLCCQADMAACTCTVPIDRPRRALLKAEEVFDTAELLESILSQLKPWDLLEVYWVTRQWQANVNGSVRLQREVY